MCLLRRFVLRGFFIAVSCMVVVSGGPLCAATVVWDGGGTDNNLMTPENWIGDIAPMANDTLAFEGSTRLAPNNNFAAGTSFAGISFAATAGAFVLGGNQIALA